MDLKFCCWAGPHPALQPKCGPEQRIQHGTERATIMRDAHMDSKRRPIERRRHWFNLEVVTIGMVLIELDRRMANGEDEVAWDAEQAKELGEEPIPIAYVVKDQGAHNQVKYGRGQKIERLAQIFPK